MAKASDFRDMSTEQLELELRETRQSLFRLRLQAATERLDAPSEMRKGRRDIARIKTVLRQRELAVAGEKQQEEGSNE